MAAASSLVLRAVLLVCLAAAACSEPEGEAVSPAAPLPGASEDDVKVDTSTKKARAQYDANVAFARSYKPRCKASGASRRVLLTGFGRFLTIGDNATGRMLEGLVPSAVYPETSPPAPNAVDPPGPQLSVGSGSLELAGLGAVDVCALILPVYWDLAAILIAKELDSFRPDLVVMNGVYPGATWLTLELGTVNRAVPEKDGSGNLSPIAGRGGEGFWGFAPLIDGLPASDDARGLLLSYPEVRAAAEAAIVVRGDDQEGGRSLREVLTSVKYGGFPRDNTYLCNNTAYTTGYLLDHPGKTVPLLRASKPLAGRINKVDTRVTFDGRDVPRVFVHWPDALVGEHLRSAGDVLKAIVAAQLQAHTPAVRGDNAWADLDLAGAPRPF